jgi:hypothetical protein
VFGDKNTNQSVHCTISKNGLETKTLIKVSIAQYQRMEGVVDKSTISECAIDKNPVIDLGLGPCHL